MKHLLFLILDHGELVDELFKELAKKKFNATVLSASSIKHALDDEDSEHVHFININHLENHISSKSTTCYFVVDENKIDELKDLIRTETKNFTKIKGAMFTTPLSDYEGSF